MAGTVIQGYFPRGVTVAAGNAPATHRPSPGWVQERIAATGRAAAPVTQPKMAAARPSPNGTAVQLPAHATLPHAHGGQPLPAAVRQRMESFFGVSFADVRVHVDASPQKIGALAFTHGSHIHFTPGHYDPATPQGRRILGHELTHVVQQRAGRVANPFGAGVAIVQDARLEQEAERMATLAAAHAPVLQRMRGRVVQRSEATVADKIESKSQSHSTDVIDLVSVKRTSLGWYGAGIQQKLGVQAKPATAQCPICKQQKTEWELDHTNPWRPYIAVCLAPDDVQVDDSHMYVERRLAKALYNDPENLRWICEDCNSAKSDDIFVSLQELQNAVKSGGSGTKVRGKQILEVAGDVA